MPQSSPTSVLPAPPSLAPSRSPSFTWKHAIVVSIGIAVAAILLYWNAFDNGFIIYDDPIYVTQNARVLQGVSLSSVAWSFTTFYCGNWHPLTWLSLCLDAQLFGPLNPWAYHVTAVLLHALNAALLFLVLWRMTGAPGCSAVVAALFAVHPTHVESVAWISERKDVLSTFFWVLTLGAYAFAVEKPSALRRASVVVAFALALMAKAMVVTLPILLLLLDNWPLARLPLGWPRLLGEKLPLFVLSALICGVAWFAHQDALVGRQDFDVPWLERVENAVGAYGLYMFKTFWPLNLAFPYQRFSEHERLTRAVVSALLILGVTLLAVTTRRRFPYLLVGWCWYLVSLLPVIGIVQGGAETGADRYTYVPSIGLFIMVTWAGAELARRWRGQTAAFVLTGVVILLCALGTWFQISYWHDNIVLFGHSLAVDDNNPVAHSQLAGGLWEKALAEARAGQPREELWDEVLFHYRRCTEQAPFYAIGHYDLGAALFSRGRLDEASKELMTAVQLQPNYADAWYMLGRTLSRQGHWTKAEAAYRNALAQNPGIHNAWEGLGAVLGRQGKWRAAADCFRGELVPSRLVDHVHLAWALTQLGHDQEAEKEYAAAARIDPNWTVTLSDAAWQLATSRLPAERDGFMAVELAWPASARAAAARVPRNLDILAAAYAEEADWTEALATAEKARSAAMSAHQGELAADVSKRIALYRDRQPYRAQENVRRK
jgi:tetratricopeptide (TPR) repeat protein